MKCTECFYDGPLIKEGTCESCGRNITGRERLRIAVIVLVYFLVARLLFYLFTGSIGSVRDASGAAVNFHFNPLESFFFPISVLEHPSYLIVMAFMLFLMVFVPVALAMAYGPLWGTVIGAMGAVLSSIHFLGPAAVIGSFISGSRYFKMKNKIVSLCLGLAPGAIFFIVQIMISPDRGLDRLETAAAHLPYFLVVFLLIVFAVVTVIAMRLNNWNPRILVMEVCIITVFILILFFAKLTTADVEYPILKRDYAIDGRLFRGIVAAAKDASEAGAVKRFEISEIDGKMDECRDRAIEAFDRFIRHYPSGDLAAGAMYEKCRVLNMKAGVLRGENGDGFILCQDTISPKSEAILKKIIDAYPLTREAAWSNLELASFYCQRGRFGEALRACQNGVDTYASRVGRDYAQEVQRPVRSVPGLIRAKRAQRRREVLDAYDDTIRRAKKMMRFIKENGDYDGEPLRKFCELNVCTPDYRERLEEIPNLYADTALEDNVLLALAASRRDVSISELEEIYAKHPGGDASDEILFRMAEVCGQSSETAMRGKAERYLERLVKTYPESPFYREAKRLLLDARERPAE